MKEMYVLIKDKNIYRLDSEIFAWESEGSVLRALSYDLNRNSHVSERHMQKHLNDGGMITGNDVFTVQINGEILHFKTIAMARDAMLRAQIYRIVKISASDL